MNFQKVILVGKEHDETVYMTAEPGSITLETSINSETILNLICYNISSLRKIDTPFPIDDITTEEFLELIGADDA